MIYLCLLLWSLFEWWKDVFKSWIRDTTVDYSPVMLVLALQHSQHEIPANWCIVYQAVGRQLVLILNFWQVNTWCTPKVSTLCSGIFQDSLNALVPNKEQLHHHFRTNSRQVTWKWTFPAEGKLAGWCHWHVWPGLAQAGMVSAASQPALVHQAYQFQHFAWLIA